MKQTILFDAVADLYDCYVKTLYDAEFFLQAVKQAAGKTLELTCGTGRLSIPLLRSGADLTCVDYSPKMLDVFRRKLRHEKLSCTLHCMDMSELALDSVYNLIFIPFQSFSEIVDSEKHLKAFRAIGRHLSDNGIFICTFHNPKVRLKSIDGNMKLLTHCAIDVNRELYIESALKYDSKTRIVEGAQFYEIYSASNRRLIEKRCIDIRFYLFDPAEIADLAAQTGFKIREISGDYDGSPFDEETSPFMIYRFSKYPN